MISDVVGQGVGNGGNKKTEFSAADIEFFENRIRPILIDRCLKCHGEDPLKLRGGLHLTSRDRMLAGGDSGPAIIPGDPDESLLIQSVRYDAFEMPPAGKLADAEIEALTKWVEMGAPDPRLPDTLAIPVREINIEQGKQFWAFQPVQVSNSPTCSNHQWAESSIDRFVLKKLESAGIAPVADADRETLIRRVHVALIGLPPTIDQIESFISDKRADDLALADVIDRLLDSKHFGERWGRHWLDVVRFAESSGGGRSLMFPEAWRFRDYVIQSFNDDKPIDQFIKEQIAGDLLPYQSHDQKIEQIVATGFLALGPTNYEQQDKELLRMEVIDEQVDTIGRAFMGLTLGCARCHDHKFDPIPMTDYYALAGIFGSTQSLVDGNVSKYVEKPLGTEAELNRQKEYRKQVSKLSKLLAQTKSKLQKLNAEPIVSTGRKSRASGSLPGIVIDDRNAELIGEWTASTHSSFFVDGSYLHDSDVDKGSKKVVFTPKLKSGGRYEVRLSYSPSGNRASNVPVSIVHQDGLAEVFVNQSQTPTIDGLFVSLGTYRFEADNVSSVTVSTTDTDGHVIVDAVQFLIQSDDPNVRATESSDASKLEPEPTEKGQRIEDTEASEEVRQLRKLADELDQKLKRLKQNAPPPPQVAMSVSESKQPADGHLHIRGSVRNLGPVVPRGLISVCCDANSHLQLEKHESGRLQLANWIASPDHPLTARVYVNRVWRHLFGRGLVSTTDNFGQMGQRPTHPQLLDYLANEFVTSGWSTKKLIRNIMLSRVYRLSAETAADGRAKDIDNHLLWRANRRRVDAEVLRDSILFASGELDLAMGGLTIRKITQYDLGYDFDTNRRSVYVPAFRNSMLDVFEIFDFANPNLVIGNRNTSTLPTQALFLMNSPLVQENARLAAQKLLRMDGVSVEQRVELAYRQTIGRRPTSKELDDAILFLDSFNRESAQENSMAWSGLFHSLFASLDFRYVD